MSGTTVTLTGVNFVTRSVVYIDGNPTKTMVDSAKQIRFVLPKGTLAAAGKVDIVVKNPEPVAIPAWGDTSNPAHVLIPFAFSTEFARND